MSSCACEVVNMVQQIEISKAEMKLLYASGLGEEFLEFDGKMYARTREGQVGNPDGYIVVWCSL